MKKLFLVVSILIFSLGLVACGSKEKEEAKSKTELFMGTVVNIKIFDGDEYVLDKAFNRVKEIEDLVSINKVGTELDKLNENAGIQSVKLSDDSFYIIKKGIEYSKLSNGGYDISIGPLVKLWSIGLPEAKVPSEDEIKEKLTKINYKDVEINEETKEIFLKKKGMILDLGSIAKGYTADEIVKILKEEGVKKAVVDLGGNVYVLGEKEKDKPWKIGIQNPFSDRGDVVGAIYVKDKSIVTTGIYERFLEKGDKKYHHILNPKTGYPYESEIAGVTIVSDKSIDGDALSTLVFTKGINEGMKFINNLEGVDAIFVDVNKNIYLTDGIEDKFELINKDFKEK